MRLEEKSHIAQPMISAFDSLKSKEILCTFECSTIILDDFSGGNFDGVRKEYYSLSKPP